MPGLEPPYPLDAIDRRILRELQADGRMTNLKLAEAVHLSSTAVLERVKRLTRDGVIVGYEARLNPAWGCLGGGCHLDRDIPALLRAGGFALGVLETMYLPGPRPLTYNYWGEALPG